MKYINKYRFVNEAHNVNVEYLKDCFQGLGLPMIPRVDDHIQSYEDFKKAKYRFEYQGRPGWQNLLMDEQEGHCCYCMRKVECGRLNIEHMVPRTLRGQRGKEEYALYAENAPAIRDFVELSDVFSQKQFADASDIDQEHRMPHITAEANLMIACNGKRGVPNTGCCCNNSRQDAYMLPIMLMEECESRVDYDENGLLSILPKEETLINIINELNDETLKTVRMIWYKISGTLYTIEQVKGLTSFIDKVKLLKAAFNVDNFELLPNIVKQYAGSIEDSDQDFYWSLLLSYEWFFFFYHNRRGNQA